MNAIIYRTCLVFLLMGGLPVLAQKYSRFHEHPAARAELVDKLAKRAAADKEDARVWAQSRGLSMHFDRNGTTYALMGLRDGHPLYYKTLNLNAAISTATDQVRSTSPFNLDGAGVDIGVWDGGTVRASHQEFGGRVTVMNPSSPYGTRDHPTHVAGTCAAGGVQANAEGMAPAAAIDSYDWEADLSEMAAVAASEPGQESNLYLSNHSYGIDSSGNHSWYGQYDVWVRTIDNVAYDSQYYLPFISSGNERLGIEGVHIPAKGGFDTISYYGIGKNVMTVGAVRDAVSGSSRSLANAAMTDFSSWGPADDGRIKPDIVANGYRVNSTVASSDTAYESYSSSFGGWWSGTSMSSPNACGSAALLVEYYKKLFPPNGAMRASTLKGLIIHTADDLGRPGPDYEFGWGLMNTLAAANLLKDYAGGASIRLSEDSLAASQRSDTYGVRSDGFIPLKVTLCWTDPAGTATEDNDSRTPALVNDLDLRISGPDGTHYPYTLSYADPTANAAFGENNVDNVEQVFIAVPEAGNYTITVDYDGQLAGSPQYYSLMVSGNYADSDGDGMTDGWETLYFGGATNAVATADLDDDGSDNYTEFEAGTLPNSSGSVFTITSYTAPISTNDPFILNWSTEAERLYTLEYSEDLLTGFLPIPGAVDLPYTQNSYTDAVERASLIFYQIRVRREE